MTRSGLKRGGGGAAAADAPEDSAAGKRVKTEAAVDNDPAGAPAPPGADEAEGPKAVLDEDSAPLEDDAVAAAVIAEAAAASLKVEMDAPADAAPPAATAKGKAAKSGGGSSLRSQAYQQQQQFNTEQMLANFDHYLFQLIAFKAEAGNFHVPKDHELHTWLQFLKREFKGHAAAAAAASAGGAASTSKSSLTDEQIKVLEFLHVPLTSRGEEHWNRFYDLLRQYQSMHGHVLVPRLCEIPGLGDWVTDQRRQYKAWKQGQQSQLTQERREKLEQLGFAWQVRNRPEWDMRFQQLLEYRDKHGDCKVPQHYKDNKALGKWTAKQREQYKLYKKGQHSFLTPYRLEKLNQIGFVWQVRSTNEEDDDDDVVAEGGDEKDTINREVAAAAVTAAMKDPPPASAVGKTDDDNLVVAEAAAAAAMATGEGVVEGKPDDLLVTANV